MVLDEIDTPITYSVIGPKDNIFAVHAVGSFTLRAAGKLVCIIFKGSLHKGIEGQIDLKPMAERQTGRQTTSKTAPASSMNESNQVSDRPGTVDPGITPIIRDGADR